MRLGRFVGMTLAFLITSAPPAYSTPPPLGADAVDARCAERAAVERLAHGSELQEVRLSHERPYASFGCSLPPERPSSRDFGARARVRARQLRCRNRPGFHCHSATTRTLARAAAPSRAMSPVQHRRSSKKPTGRFRRHVKPCRSVVLEGSFFVAPRHRRLAPRKRCAQC